ncbi:MAG: L-aspartate oxidase [Aquificae bacterium]|nr:L-aspartate oxidase [Aquificota bacterium]
MRFFLAFDASRLPDEEAQVLVCGSGIAGLSTAIYLKELGLNPVILTRGIGNTYYSQGGIAAAVQPYDSPHLHYCDTVRAGRFLNDEEKTRLLAYEGPMRIADLVRWGVEFDREGGEFLTTVEGGHSRARVLRAKDFTGREISTKLFRRLEELGVPVVFGELQEVFTEDGRVAGVLYAQEGTLKVVRTSHVVLASGGAASMYLYTSNPKKVRGDGIGLAFRSGASVKNPEFVQFHPTVLRETGLLISEAVRGEGAVLINDRGERFVDELLPRDEVARAIYRQMKQGRRVFLDLRPLIKKGIKLEERFPTSTAYVRESGYEPTVEPVPVSPAAHYYIGGVEVDDRGRSSIEGFYAVGESACTGVHGANRLASNSLLEGVVFAHRLAYQIYLEYRKPPGKLKFRNDAGGSSGPSFTLGELKKLMWEKAGLERDEEGLAEAQRRITRWLKEARGWARTPENRQMYDILLVALCTVLGARARKESRGVHYRTDYPHEREVFRRDTVIAPEYLQELF